MEEKDRRASVTFNMPPSAPYDRSLPIIICVKGKSARSRTLLNDIANVIFLVCFFFREHLTCCERNPFVPSAIYCPSSSQSLDQCMYLKGKDFLLPLPPYHNKNPLSLSSLAIFVSFVYIVNTPPDIRLPPLNTLLSIFHRGFF